MKFRILDTFVLGVAATGLSAGHAHAQLFSLDLTINRTQTAVGAPRPTTSTGAGGIPAGPVVVWSTTLPYAGGGFVFSGSSTDPASLTSATDRANLLPALAAYNFSKQQAFADRQSLVDFLDVRVDTGYSDFEFDYLDECLAGPQEWATRTGIALGSAVTGNCDKLGLQLDVDGVSFKLDAAQGSPLISIAVPSINLSFTSGYNAASPQIPEQYYRQYSRSDGLAQFEDYLRTSGKDKELVAKLLGQSSGFTLPKGSLPTGGDFFVFDVNFTRTGGVNYSKSIGANSFGEIIAYWVANLGATDADFGLGTTTGLYDYKDTCLRSQGTTVQGACDAATVTVGVLGITATLASAENSPDVSLNSADLGISFTSSNAIDRESALDQISDYVDANVTEKQLIGAFQNALISRTPDNPVAGNPQSLQGTFVGSTLMLDQPSTILQEDTVDLSGGDGDVSDSASSSSSSSSDGRRREGDSSAWMVGGRIGSFQAGTFDGKFIDIALERGWRLGEGGRSRLKVSAPISFLDYGDGEIQSTASVRVGYEYPLQDGKWVVEPSASVGYAFDTDKYAAGALWAAGVSTRYKIAPVGKGHIVLGSSVAYSSSFDIEDDSSFKTADVENVAFRNGVAYQTPVGQRIFGRLGTMRASYAYTTITGDELFLDAYHEVSFSYGVGARESTIRNVAETIRIGLGGSFGEDYESFTMNAGFRF